MKRLIGPLAALVLLAPLMGAASDVVCTATPPSATTCSGATASVTVTISCTCDPNPSPTPTPAPSSLLTGLVSSWPLSADGTDEYGSNDLTNNNAVTFVAKGVGAPANLPDNVANFVAVSNQYLSSTSQQMIPNDGTSWTFSVWMTYTTTTGYMTPVTRGSDIQLLRDSGTANWRAYVNGAYAGDSAADANNWHHYIFWYDASDSIVRLSIDNSAAAASFPVTPTNNGFPFNLGRRTDGFYLDGQMSLPMAWSRALSSDERTCLNNSGAAVQYPFTGVCN